jgi:putative membrane protein
VELLAPGWGLGREGPCPAVQPYRPPGGGWGCAAVGAALADAGPLALWRPDLAAGALAVVLTYLRWGMAGPGGLAERAWRGLAFLCGLALLYGAFGTPVAWLADHWLLSARVLQEVLVAFGAAPLLLLGLPPRVCRVCLRPTGLRRAARQLTRPVVAVVTFHGLLALDLAAPVVDALRLHPWLVPVQAAVLLAASLLMWCPLLVDLPELAAPGYAVQLLYLFVNWLLVTLAFALFTFGDGLPYPAYAAHASALGISPKADRQLGGIFLGALSHLAYLVALGAVFARWARHEGLTASPTGVYTRLRTAGWTEEEARRIAGLPDAPGRPDLR